MKVKPPCLPPIVFFFFNFKIYSAGTPLIRWPQRQKGKQSWKARFVKLCGDSGGFSSSHKAKFWDDSQLYSKPLFCALCALPEPWPSTWKHTLFTMISVMQEIPSLPSSGGSAWGLLAWLTVFFCACLAWPFWGGFRPLVPLWVWFWVHSNANSVFQNSFFPSRLKC